MFFKYFFLDFFIKYCIVFLSLIGVPIIFKLLINNVMTVSLGLDCLMEIYELIELVLYFFLRRYLFKLLYYIYLNCFNLFNDRFKFMGRYVYV